MGRLEAPAQRPQRGRPGGVFGVLAGPNHHAAQGRLPAQGAAIHRPSRAVGQRDALVAHGLEDGIVGAEDALSAIATILQLAEAFAQRHRAVDHSAEVRQGGVAVGERVKRLRQQHPELRRIDVLRLVEQADRRLHLARANAEALIQLVVSLRPVQRDRVGKVAQQQVSALYPDPQLRLRPRRDIDDGLGPRRAAVARVHGVPVVVCGVDKALGGVPVDLNFEVIHALSRGAGCAMEPQQGQHRRHH